MVHTFQAGDLVRVEGYGRAVFELDFVGSSSDEAETWAAASSDVAGIFGLGVDGPEQLTLVKTAADAAVRESPSLGAIVSQVSFGVLQSEGTVEVTQTSFNGDTITVWGRTDGGLPVSFDVVVKNLEVGGSI